MVDHIGTAEPQRGRRVTTSSSKGAKRRPTRTADDEIAPRGRIIAAAETLFARKGLHGAPLREIAREASINVNLVSYYFPAKEDLFNAVVDLRAAKLNDARDRMLDALEEAYTPASPPVEKIIHSLIHPFFALRTDDATGWSRWQQLLNRETGTEVWNRAMARNLAPVLRRYLYTLHRALPLAKRADILFILELATRAMVLAAEVEMTAILPDAVAADWSDDQIEARIVVSLTAAATVFGTPPD